MTRDPQAHRTPRWVVLLAVAIAIVVLVVIVLMVVAGGSHGPGRHG